jgi:DNA-binding CsgD family transcriptional regulator
MTASGEVVRAIAGRLAATDPQSDQALRETVAAAVEGDVALGSRGIAQPLLSPGGETYLAHVLPLANGMRRQAGQHYAAAAALFVHRASVETVATPEAIARRYKLTPSELRVLMAVVQVGGVEAAAEAIGIAQPTVRTHLHHVFEKTGARSQADLVRLFAAFSTPIR